MGNSRNCIPTASAPWKALTPLPRTHLIAALVFPLLLFSFGSRGDLPLLPPPRRAARRVGSREQGQQRTATPARPHWRFSVPVRPGPALPGSCPGETGPRLASTPQRRPHNPSYCSARCLAPFGTGGARNSDKDITPLSPLSLRGSVYSYKYLTVIAGRGKEPAPAPGGVTRASWDKRGAATRRSRRDGGHPCSPETLSAPFCITDLGRGRHETQEGGTG